MHIRPVEPGQPGSGRQQEAGNGRRLRLGGGASRVPVQPQRKATETPLRALVSAIGQSLSTRTPLKNQPSGSRTPSSVKNSLFSSKGKPSSTTPAGGMRGKSLFSSEGRVNGTSPTANGSVAASSSSRVPSTPKTSRTQAPTGTPSNIPATPISKVRATAAASSRRSSLSSSSSLNSISSTSTTKLGFSSSTPTSRKAVATPSTASRRLDSSSTPATKKSSIPPRTPRAPNNPTTPSSKPSCITLPTPRRPAVSSTPRSKQTSTPQTRSKSFFPSTPVSKIMAVHPSTPIDGDNGFSTPYTQQGTNQTFYTPKSTLPLTPLQPRNFNLPESSRKLHFGINVAAMAAEHENMGNTTPRPAGVAVTEATFSFDKNRLAQIKARKNTSQVLKSPAQRVRVPDFQHPAQSPSRVLRQVAEHRTSRFDEGDVVNSLNQSPTRRVANSLF